MDILGMENNFKSLSIGDLLAVRDQYHWHLMNKANVVGTAIGLYLIRNSDPLPQEMRTRVNLTRDGWTKSIDERTFANSEVRDYSWPCVLVLVKEWFAESAFTSGGRLSPQDLVPKTLYMSDGRTVPVCVVKVEQASADGSQLPDWHWPTGLFGGGMPIIAETQGREHVATAGCLVTDGHTTYMLTSRHACGSHGETLYTMAGGERVAIGEASAKHLSRLLFSELYPEFSAYRTFVSLDVGLVELYDRNEWTSAVFGLGALGPLADLNELNISLRLIEAPVVAAGAASGRLEGRIKALFYRYKSVGGYDYLSDFLIAPRALDEMEPQPVETSAQTRPGDSGTVWHLVQPQPQDASAGPEMAAGEFDGMLRPLAVQWGGQVFQDNGGTSRFAFTLATSLTNVCQQLDVELVIEDNKGVQPYWGQLGHYSIATFAADMLPAGKLRSFLKANLDSISFGTGDLDGRTISEKLKTIKEAGDLVPLADLPDIIWKAHKTKVKGGRDDLWVGDGRSGGPEHPTHWADVDEPRTSDGKTLMDLCLEDSANLSVAVWQSFYAETNHLTDRDRGLLPFRVWQFFDAMKAFAANKEVDKFLCAAGVLSHYVGDACQPLHGSMFSDGYSDQEIIITRKKRGTGETYEETSHVGAGVHSTYETKMIDRYAIEIVAGVPQSTDSKLKIPAIHSGHDAAVATIELMHRAATLLPPTDIADAYVAAGGKNVVAVQDALWNRFGDATIMTMANGARVLARIWRAAWTAGQGSKIASTKLGAIDPLVLRTLCERADFVPSVYLNQIGALLDDGD